MKQKFIMMPVIIQGPKQLSNDIDVYLRPLVEERLQLWNGKGVRAWDELDQEEDSCQGDVVFSYNIPRLKRLFQNKEHAKAMR